MEDAPGALTPFNWPSPSPSPMSSSPDEPMVGAEFDDQLGRERQKYRRYRKRLPRTSLLASDLQLTPMDTGQTKKQEMPHTPDSQGEQKVTPKVQVKLVKEEAEEVPDSGELSFDRFAVALFSWLHDFTSLPDLLLEFETICRDLSEALRDESQERQRALEARLLRQKAQLLHSEASSWALVWHLFGKGDEDMGSDMQSTSTSSVQIARELVKNDGSVNTCLRLVQWLEGLASKELDLEKKRKGWYAGSYIQKLGMWDHTRRAIHQNTPGSHIVKHVDPDAPTREGAPIHLEDQKLEEGLLEDVWKLLQAGRVNEAQNLCRSAGQSWRAASLGGCLMGYSPSAEGWNLAESDRVLEAIELDGGVGHQRRLWKWACFCASEKIASNDGGGYERAIFALQCANVNHVLPVCADWESACWALARSWLDVQIELEIVRQSQENRAPTISGAEKWPNPVLDQQPRDFENFFQKLYSGSFVHENVRRGCKEQHRLVQMDMVIADMDHLLELLKAWILPGRDGQEKPHGHPQVIRFAAHLVLILRFILPDEIRERCNERLHLVGDLILNTYAVFLFTQHKEELVGAYASHLAPHLCVDMYVHMMELRQNDSEMVKRKLLSSAMEYLPFYSEDGTKGSISDICDRFLENSRQVTTASFHIKQDPEKPTALSKKGQVVQWLCFEPSPGLSNFEQLREELLARALKHSVILLREISLVSLRRASEGPASAHTLLALLGEPVKDSLSSLPGSKEDSLEFLEWEEYFSCDALYRSWLALQSFVSQSEEEKARSLDAAEQALDAALGLLRTEGGWLSECYQQDSEWLELTVTAVLSNDSGPTLVPDATICTTLTSALYLCAGEAASVERQLTVKVSVNPRNEDVVDIGLRCTVVEAEHDGGFLSAIISAAIKGELPHFQPGVALEILRMDACCIQEHGTQYEAPSIVRGLCRRCCIPELVLRCLQILAWLQAHGDGNSVCKGEDELIALVANVDGLHNLFSSKQLEELVLLQRETILRRMEAAALR